MNPAERRALVGTLNRMASDSAAERDEAARTACAILMSASETWESIVAIPASPFSLHGADFREQAVALLQRPALLDDADAAFLRKIMAWRKLGAAERTRLEGIVSRVADMEGGDV